MSNLFNAKKALAVVAGVAVAGLTLITSTVPSQAASLPGSGINIAIMGGAPDDPFWSTVKNGALSAAAAVRAAGGRVTFLSMPNYKNFAPDAAKLVANMKALKPSAVIIPDWVPDAQNANIKAISDAGIPVIIYNSGQSEVSKVGGKIYIGSDDYVAGKAAGAKMSASGAKHVICVNTLPGTVNIDARCKGVADGASSSTKVEDLNLPSSQFGNPSAIAQAVKGALQKDTTIDAVVTIGQADSDSAASALAQANLTSKVKLGTFDVAANGLNRVAAGTQLFSIDQQPFAQGYYGVSYAFQLAAYAIELPIAPFLTGPALITKDNVAVVLKAVKFGAR